MILAVIVGLCAGAFLAQHFRALIIVPASLVAVAFGVCIALIGAHGGAQIAIQTIAATGALQIGYFIGLLIRPVAADPQKAQLNTALPR
jgi:membrane protein DedA with SNARE-associated domain